MQRSLWGPVVTRNQNRKRNSQERGGVSIQMLVILVPVLFGFMGFAVDLGRLYLVKGELNQAASAMATAAASQLNGTTQAATAAANAAQSLLDDSLNSASRYNLGSIVIGQASVGLNSGVDPTALFATAQEAIAAAGQPGAVSAADGSTARHVTINLNADAPLLFWSLLSLGQSRHVSIAATAVAGMSAPLCTACGIEPFAIAPIDAGDTTNFGFTPGNAYTLGMQCTGAAPALLAGTTAPRVAYLIVDRYDSGGALLEDQQLFRIGAQGMIPSNPAFACSRINNTENIWATAAVRACAAPGVSQSVQNLLCGLSTRFTTTTPAACSANADLNDLVAAYPADTNSDSITDYPSYDGNSRRVITVAVVDALSTGGAMQVQGFRQFLLNPTPGVDPVANNPADANGRYAALYLGSVMPVKQGRFDGSCGATAGPGKVVLHQ